MLYMLLRFARRKRWAVCLAVSTALCLSCLVLAMAMSLAAGEEAVPGEGKYVRLEKPDVLGIWLGGRKVAEYRFGKDLPKPYLYPVFGPDGKPMTEDAPSDHVHHHSLFFSYDEVGAYHFWREGKGGSPMRHEKFLKIYDEERWPGFTSVNAWMGGEKPLLRDTRTLRFVPLENGEYLIDISIELYAVDQKVTIGSTKEAGLPGLRMAPELTVKAGGRMVNSEGQVNEKECWGKRANWLDYTGPRPDGTWVGIAYMAHPSNRPYPPGWHARDYGLLAANYTNWDKPMTLELGEGKAWTLRSRLYVHRGKTEEAKVAEQFQRYRRVRKGGIPPMGSSASQRRGLPLCGLSGLHRKG